MALVPPPAASDRHQLQQIVAGLTEGVIIVDADQALIWANPAALKMHGVASLADLGTTVDAYRERFNLQYRNNHKLRRGDHPIERVIAGEAFHDVVVEVSPPGAHEPCWVHRVRSLVLTHRTGEPDCLVLILADVTEQFEAEERFESSFNANPAPAVICRVADGLFIKVNRGFLELTGFSKPDVIGRSVTDLDLLADSPHRQASLASMARSEPLPQSEARLRTADGGHKTVIVAGQPIEVNDHACMLFTFIDLEPMRAAQAALRDSERRSQASFEALYTETPVAMHSLDPDQRIISVSNRWLELFGYRRDEVTGRKIADFMTKAAAGRHAAEGWPELLRRGCIRDEEYQFVKSDGETADILVCAQVGRDEAGSIRAMAFLTDITARKHGEDRFEKAFRLAPVPMLVCSMRRLRPMIANEAFLDASGYTIGDLAGSGTHAASLWEDQDARAQLEADLRQGLHVRNREARLLCGDETLDCLVSAEPVVLQGEQCALLALQDVTERRRSETQLFEAIEAVMQDTSWFSRAVIDKLAQLRQPPSRQGAALDALTKREYEVLGHVSEGLNDAGIATRLGLSKSTVRNHVAALYVKIGVHSRSAAIVWARERGVTAGRIAETHGKAKPRISGP